MISAAQIRAARSLLGWSQGDLAGATGLSRATIRTVELGNYVRPGNVYEIHRVMEMRGIKFLEGNGVRQQPQGKKEYTGQESCENFFKDVLQTIEQHGGNIVCVVDDQNVLTKANGSSRRNNIQRLNEIQKTVNVKCLLADVIAQRTLLSLFEIRGFTEMPVFPMSVFSYGNQLAFCYLEHDYQFAFIIIDKIPTANNFRSFFAAQWDLARPFSA